MSERIDWKARKTRRPEEGDRTALRDEIVGQARAVRDGGWGEHRTRWSDGRAATVAYLLGDTEVLDEFAETEGSVLTRLAADLFGFTDGRKDVEKGLIRTQEWLATVRAELGRG
ncbi:hypothetical protein [Nocardia thailandica]